MSFFEEKKYRSDSCPACGFVPKQILKRREMIRRQAIRNGKICNRVNAQILSRYPSVERSAAGRRKENAVVSIRRGFVGFDIQIAKQSGRGGLEGSAGAPL
jgi:hypothetical protein